MQNECTNEHSGVDLVTLVKSQSVVVDECILLRRIKEILQDFYGQEKEEEKLEHEENQDPEKVLFVPILSQGFLSLNCYHLH